MLPLLTRLLAASLLLCPVAHAADLTVLVDASTPMPMADIRDGQLRGGVHWDLGRALAAQMGRTAQFKVLPRKRIAPELESGRGDIACVYLPAWLPGPFGWSEAFIPGAEVLVSAAKAVAPAKPAALAGQPVGTVLGFKYPELEQALGPRFVRDDAPTMESSWHKLMAGRVQHGVFNKFFVDYQLRRGQLAADAYPVLAIHIQQQRCAVSRHGQVTLAQVNKAVAGLQAQHGMDKLLEPYRPLAAKR